jgi:hypothetical protein
MNFPSMANVGEGCKANRSYQRLCTGYCFGLSETEAAVNSARLASRNRCWNACVVSATGRIIQRAPSPILFPAPCRVV